MDLGQGNTQLINTVTSLREIEEKIRNIAAHQIVSVSDDTIKKLTGYTALDVIKFIHRAFTYAGINIKGDYWDAYEQMNASIVAMIHAM